MDTRSMKQEYLARAGIIAVILAAIALIWSGVPSRSTTLVLTGTMPEHGGWQPDVIKAQAGEPLHLRLTSNDVVHGFAIGQMEGTATDVIPGKFTEVNLTFHEPGTYTYYCTRWCGPNHWRMRGTIEVEGESPPQSMTEKKPLYLQLGIDIDADHEASVIPTEKPSPSRGASLNSYLPQTILQRSDYFEASPVQLFEILRGEDTLSDLADHQLWDLVAEFYWKNTSNEDLLKGQQLYNENCAACHGLSGQGDGVFSESEEYLSKPTNFSDPKIMLGANSALLQGKIIRGGMGTGMPYWGTIFTEDQTWSLVNYIWSFQFDYPFDK